MGSNPYTYIITLFIVIVNKKNEDSENDESNNKLKVVEQMPEAGVKLESGTQIRLKVK